MICINARFLSQRITGSQRYCLEIGRRLKRLDPGLRFLAPRDVVHAAAAAELGAEVVGHRTGVPWEHIDLPRHLRGMGSPLLASMQYTAPATYPSTIVTVHDVVFLHREWVSFKFHWWYRWLIPRLCRTAKRLVTVSEFSRREIAQSLRIPEDRIEVVSGAVDPAFARQADHAGDNPYGRYVLGVATLNRRKNFKGLVRAFVRSTARDTKLVIAGATDAKIFGRDAELEGLLRDPRIVQAGYVTDAQLAALYKHAAVFVFPSFYEGFGIPPLEAMLLGCPVITSNVSSLPEVCGDAAHYVDPHDDGDIARGLDLVLRDEAYRRSLIAKGRERVQHFDWQRSAEKFLAIVRSA